MSNGLGSPLRALLIALSLSLIAAPAAQASFPFKPQGAPGDYSSYRLPSGANQTPRDLGGKLTWMYASTADPGAGPAIRNDKRELGGVRGAHLADTQDVDQGWRVTTGRPDVTISILDSGIEWNNDAAMQDVRKKARISRGETPVPQADRTTSTEAGEDCSNYHAGAGGDPRDLNR